MQSNQPNIDPTHADAASFDSPVVPILNEEDQQNAQHASQQASQRPIEQSSLRRPQSKSVTKRNRVEIWNVPFDVVTLTDSILQIGSLIDVGEPSYVITANLNYVMLHNQREEMKPVTADAALIVADGQPIVMRSKLSKQPLPERVAGSEMIYHLAEKAAQRGWKIYFLGGELGVADVCATRLAKMYTGLQVAGIESPPFRALTEQEQLAQDQRIQDSGADILLVAFGQPKGEQWIHHNHKRLGVPVSIQLGASFDFVAGTAVRAPKIWQKTGMEWFYRMVNDPRRMVKRYSANAWFLFLALVEDWRRTVNSWGMGLDSQTKR